MGGKGKKGVASLEKQQARQVEQAKKEKKKAKKEEKGQQKAIYVTNEAHDEFLKFIKPGSHYTLYELASKLNISLGLARRAIRELEEKGKLIQISKSRNSRLYVAS
jgi:ribosomal protein S25